ncbi:TolB family protein [Stigmatella aurantiaca]|uniref:Protein TolB n=1 Tax=Stigmatella aurantiaca (strain DW4/3-1) TaxID=378806 RepID=Q08X78_STIAD|nr:LpqB family beta-propeller domain-containing protein [Stigmatella aurantiaca]ADO75892.1 Tol-pal system beta propeller repeat protein [Stigmatella aurantiaca DW4/3-1]EAU65097.1 protein TolB [Stigmatella aurantiaca DW4/3-1]
MLALLGWGCRAGTCGRAASGPGPLSEEERRAIPGVIAFISERADQKDVWLVKPSGEETQLTKSPGEDDFPAAPSPDGKALLVIAARMVNGFHLEQMRLQPLDGGEPVALHPPRARTRNPSWSPDGRWLVAESDARSFSDLVRLEPKAGTQEQPLTQVKEGCFEPAVSPDGREVAFVSSREGDPEIYVMKADGTDERRITAFHQEDREPRWSPDGQWLSFISNREGRERYFLVRPDGTSLRAVSGEATKLDERELAWSPDSKKVVFVERLPEAKSRLWVAAVDGGAPVALTDGRSRDDAPAWSPDGKYLVFVAERQGDVDLWLMRADGSGQTRLTTAKGPDWLPRWFVPR